MKSCCNGFDSGIICTSPPHQPAPLGHQRCSLITYPRFASKASNFRVPACHVRATCLESGAASKGFMRFLLAVVLHGCQGISDVRLGRISERGNSTHGTEEHI